MQKECETCKCMFYTPRRATKFCRKRCYYDSRCGKVAHPNTAKALRTNNIGKKFSEEHRRNLSISHTKVYTSEELGLKLQKSKLSKVYYGLIGRALGWKKKDRTLKELGYSSEDLRLEIERKFRPGMTWANHGKGRGKWHVDHVRQISSFPIGTSPKVVNALSNLQPLWEEENLSKNKRRQ